MYLQIVFAFQINYNFVFICKNKKNKKIKQATYIPPSLNLDIQVSDLILEKKFKSSEVDNVFNLTSLDL